MERLILSIGIYLIDLTVPRLSTYDLSLIEHKFKKAIEKQLPAKASLNRLKLNNKDQECLKNISTVSMHAPACLEDLFFLQSIDALLLGSIHKDKIEILKLAPGEAIQRWDSLEHWKFQKEIPLTQIEGIEKHSALPPPAPSPTPLPATLAWYNKKELGWIFLGAFAAAGAGFLIVHASQSPGQTIQILLDR